MHMCTCIMDEKGIDLVRECEWWHNRRESGMERVREKRKEGKKRGKCFEGKERLFAFCVIVSFTTSFSTLFNPPCHHSSSYALTHTSQSTTHHFAHNTLHKHACVLSSLFVTVSALNPHTIKQHNTMQTCNHHHMAQPMDDATSEWERAVVIEDTTPQTPSTTMK